MNEDKLMEYLINIHHFIQDLMNLNIELEKENKSLRAELWLYKDNNIFLNEQLKLKDDIIKESIKYINKTEMGEGYKKELLELLESDKE